MKILAIFCILLLASCELHQADICDCERATYKDKVEVNRVKWNESCKTEVLEESVSINLVDSSMIWTRVLIQCK